MKYRFQIFMGIVLLAFILFIIYMPESWEHATMGELFRSPTGIKVSFFVFGFLSAAIIIGGLAARKINQIVRIGIEERKALRKAASSKEPQA